MARRCIRCSSRESLHEGARPLRATRGTVATSPPARDRHTLATLAGKVVLFGGGNNTTLYLNDTWEWDGATWRERTPSTAPSARANHAMATMP